ncbi:hypothetical protein LTR36_002120 [Oleoguttula mirabilis]|uniref:GH16 domain-containing protein n=1 Tax=Oleoguttula mirabilis TaxID=1507867 RepID=A0AAV9JME5_9PEZI|nr:hypothetical protein LTR36_002120 [Oleoguttula mirabilis]
MDVSFVLALLGIALRVAASDCSCGYTVNATSSGDYALFTEHFEADFVNTPGNVTWDSQPGLLWQAQEYNTTPAAARGPYGKAAQPENVVLDNGLQLWVRSRLLDSSSGQLIPISEVVTARSDILYGSIRVGMKTTTINGTCGAFFFYHNDSEEIDMEVLSQQQEGDVHPVNLVNQSPDSVASGYNAVNSSGFIRYNLTFDPASAFKEFRFDWLPDRIDMYADNVWLKSFHDYVPSAPGALHLIHWSNGDPGWSGGPPTQDAVLTISYVNAYFNTTTPSQSTETCSEPVSTNHSCEISAMQQGTSTGSVSGSPTASGTASHPTRSGGATTAGFGAWPLFRNTTLLAFLVVFIQL